jgi:hypothetical protein
MKFRDLQIGQTFDWINDAKPFLNSFYHRCEKTSARGYKDSNEVYYTVGSGKAEVYHVVEKD